MTGTRQDLGSSETVEPARGRRTYAAARRHTAVVRTLKFAIPVGAALAVAGVFGWSYVNPLNRIPGLTLGPVSISGTKIAMERPRLTGYRNKDKRPYEVTATAAFQDIRKPNVIELKDMVARMAIDESGTIAHLRSKLGVLDTGKEHLDLTDDIRAWTERGEEMLLKSAAVDLKAGAVVSREPVQLRTPTLTLDAGGMEIAQNGGAITFTGRVHTVLTRGLEGDGTAPKIGKRATVAQDGDVARRITQAEAGGNAR